MPPPSPWRRLLAAYRRWRAMGCPRRIAAWYVLEEWLERGRS
jgi:hypothetical protein